MKTELEQALEWWNSLSFDKKHELAVKYDNVAKIEIWKKETQEFNPTFNPDAHSHLVIDFEKEQIQLDSDFTGALNELLLSKVNNKVESIEEYLNKEYPDKGYDEEHYCDINKDIIKPHAIQVVLSEAVKNYWYSQFLKEHGRS